MTEGAIETVTLQSAAEQLKDKIRFGFAELIPPEQWKSMIETELTRFTERKRTGYGNETRPSIFQDVCEQVFREFVTQRVKKVLDASDAGTDHWNHKVGELVKEWLNENQERLIQTTILALAGHAAQGLLASMAAQRVG